MAYQNLIGSYTHEQSSAAATWTVHHNLGQDAPVVDCWTIINAIRTNIIPESVTATSANIVTIVFSEPRTGFAALL